MPSSSLFVVSRCTIYPDHHQSLNNTLKLSVSDLPMLSCQYIQKGVLLTQSPFKSSNSLISHLKTALSKTLSHFPPLAGRLITDSDRYVYILCNDAGVDFVHARAPHLTISTLVLQNHSDIPIYFRKFFQFDSTLSYAGHYKPLMAIQVTELKDGVFIGCTMNHAVVDGTSFWNFFNTFAEFSKGEKKITRQPCFGRKTVFNSPAVLKFPEGGPSATFSGDEPIREKIFHFSREAILKLKYRANKTAVNGKITPVNNDEPCFKNGSAVKNSKTAATGTGLEISSFQSLSAQLWRSVTRARKLDGNKTTTFRMAVNCRHRLEQRIEPLYFGNAIQSIPTVASVKELLSNDLYWSANQLHQNVVAHGDATVRRGVKDWESNPRLFPLGNFDGAMITMGSSPRFPMYDNDFGWGRPVAVRSGMANKFDGKISAFPGREGNGTVDLEVVLAPETMAGLEEDMEFMQYVS
ncbi:unnamed protein product [Withania somnifera]